MKGDNAICVAEGGATTSGGTWWKVGDSVNANYELTEPFHGTVTLSND